MNKPTLILSSDWHIRSDIPENRIDDFVEAQERKIDFILNLSNKYQCPIFVAGDIGNKPKWENWLLEKYIKKFKNHSQKIYVLPGQHDLPNHRFDKLKESGLGVLVASKCIQLLLDTQSWSIGQTIINCYNFFFGKKIENVFKEKRAIRNIAVIHQLISQAPLWKGQQNFTSAKSLLKKFPCYDLIISGDNHQSFIEKYKGRLLVNPGSIMRTTIAQFNHEPKIYLWNVENNRVKTIKIPIQSAKEVFDLSTIKKQEKRNERINVFIDSLSSNYKLKMSFTDNLNAFLNENEIEQKIKDKIFMALEKER